MAIPKRTATRILSFAQAVQSQGTAQALQGIGLGNLTGQPIKDVYPHLIDALCDQAEGGKIDEGIARDALCEAVAEICGEGQGTADTFSADELQALFTLYVSNTIFRRVFLDICQSGIALPADTDSVLAIERDVRDQITASVQDSITGNALQLGGLAPQALATQTDRIYEMAWDIIVTRANNL